MAAADKEGKVPLGNVFPAPEVELDIETEHLSHPYKPNQVFCGRIPTLAERQQWSVSGFAQDNGNAHLLAKIWELENKVKTQNVTIQSLWNDNKILILKAKAENEKRSELQEEMWVVGVSNRAIYVDMEAKAEDLKLALEENSKLVKEKEALQTVSEKLVLEEKSKLVKENEILRAAGEELALRIYKLSGIWTTDQHHQSEMRKKPNKPDLTAAIENVEVLEKICSWLDEGEKEDFRNTLTNGLRFSILLTEMSEMFKVEEQNEKKIQYLEERNDFLEEKNNSLETNVKNGEILQKDLKERLSRAETSNGELKESLSNLKERFHELESNFKNFLKVVLAKLRKQGKIGLDGERQVSYIIEVDEDDLRGVIKSLKKVINWKPKSPSENTEVDESEEMQVLEDV